MYNCNHLKKNKILIQLSNGSVVYLFCYINKKELLVDSDIKSNKVWNCNPNTNELNNTQNKLFNNFKKLFLNHK